MTQHLRSACQGLTNFWDRLFALCDEGLRWFAKQWHDGSANQNKPRHLFLALETLEPRWVLDVSYTLVHGQTLTVGAGDGLLSGTPPGSTLVSIGSWGDGTFGVEPLLSLGSRSVDMSNGSFTVTAPPGLWGPDNFSYEVDEPGSSGSAHVSEGAYFMVTNQNPVTANDTYSVAHATTLSVTDPTLGVLANDYDPDSDSISVSTFGQPTYGSVSVNKDGTFTYTPPSTFVGTDQFTYSVTDNIDEVGSGSYRPDNVPATVYLNVAAGAPTAGNDSYSVVHNQTLNVTDPTLGLLANASDPNDYSLTAAALTTPAHGSVTVNSDGTFDYEATTGFVGTDTFAFTVSDGVLSATGHASINVTDTPPVAVNDSYQIMQDHTLTVNTDSVGLLGNDYDPDSDSISVVGNSSPSHGTVSVSPDGTFTYDPTTNYTGSDSFTYTISDGMETATGTVDMTVAASPSITPTYGFPSPAAPTLTNPGSQTNNEGDSVSLGITASDASTYTLSYSAANLPYGLSIDSSSGVISGTVAAETSYFDSGVYDVTLVVGDTNGGVATTDFDWTISPAPPVVSSPGDKTNVAGDNVSFTVMASQYDSDPLEFDATNLPDGLSIDPDTGIISGSVAPDAVSSTPYSVTVTATDYTPTTATTGSQTFNWSVGAGTPDPTSTNPGGQVNSTGDYVDVELDAADNGGYPVTVTAANLPPGLSIDPSSGEVTGTLANDAASDTPYSVTVTVSDGQTSETQSFNWSVSGVSLTSPGDQVNLDGDSVSMPLSATDSTSATLTYSASGLPSGLTINSASGLISGAIGSTADASSPDTVTVTVSDGSTSNTQTFNWEVDRLAIALPNDQDGVDGGSVSMALSATDNEGTPTFSVSGLPSGLTLNTSTGIITGTLSSSAHEGSPYQVTVNAMDGSDTVTQSFVWTVTPNVAFQNPGPQYNAVGDSVSIALTAQDLDSGSVSYSASGLPSGISLNSSTGVITGTLGSGDLTPITPYVVTVTASDGTYSSSQPFSWTVSWLNLPSPGDQDNLDDDSVSLSMAASYHGMGSVSYSVTGLPDGLSLNTSTGLISGTVANTADADGPYDTVVTATDGTDSTAMTINWEVDPRVSVDPIDDQTNVPGDSVSFPVTSEEGSADTVTWTYSASGLPSGLSINSATGIISGTITASVGTSDTVTVAASDGTGSASQTFVWNLAPVSLSNPGSQATVGDSSVNLALSADVASGYTATYSASGLPTGLSINTSTGVISGTLDSGDTGNAYLVNVTATADSVTSSQDFTWQVSAVVVQPISDQTTTEGGSVSIAVTAQALSGTLVYTADELPAGLTINSSTGVISGTVGAGAAANGPDYMVTVIATAGTNSNSQSFDWTVNPAVVVTSLDDQTNTEGDSVSIPVTATEALATLSYSATGLPYGLTINGSTGLISGTVATGDSSTSYAVDVTVSDGTNTSDVYFNWTIYHAGDTSPTLTAPATQVNVVGDSVNLQLSASDSDSSDTLTFSADGLPDGLSIDPNLGVISGYIAEDALQSTPYSVTVTVDNGNGGTVSQTFNWDVNDSLMTVTGATIVPPAISAGVDPGSVTIATFTDTDPNWDPSEFTATINWGDGTSSTGDVEGGGGVYTVAGDHVYDAPGLYSPQVFVTDGFTIASGTGSVSVGVSTIALTGSTEIGDVTSSSASGTWASFTDTNLTTTGGDYTATINWGDGSATTTGTVTGSDGDFIISGSHNYTTDGADTVTITLADDGGSTFTTASTVYSTTQVGDMYAGESASITLASFTVADPTEPASAYTAIVNWGDGSATSTATVTGSDGVFTVVGSHLYSTDSIDQPGGYVATVTLTGPNEVTLNSSGNESALTATKNIIVTRPEITGSGETLTGTASIGFNNVEVASFTDPDLADGTGEFSATINWGDGTTSDGTVVGLNGQFQVLGSHEYETSGTFVIEVDVSQAWYGLERATQVDTTANVPASEQPTDNENPVLFPDKDRGNDDATVNAEQKKWDDDKTVRDAIIVVTKESDLTNNIKPGQDFKYVVRKNGTLVVFKDIKIPHSDGTASKKDNTKVGEDVQAAGHARYYVGLGIIFDLNTMHYKIMNAGKEKIMAAQQQATKAFTSISHDVNDNTKSIAKADKNSIEARYVKDVKMYKENEPKLK